MGRKGVFFIGFLPILLAMVVVWMFHWEAGLVSSPLLELPLNFPYMNPIIQRIVPPMTSSDPSHRMGIEKELSRSFLSSEKVTDVSPSQTIPSAHPPIEESLHNLRHHGKAHSNVPSPALALLPQLKFPPMSTPTNPSVQKTLPSAPTSAPSYRISVEYKDSRLVSSSLEFLSPHMPSGERTDVSSLPPFPYVLPPIGESLHNPSYHGRAQTDAPTPGTNVFPSQPIPPVLPPIGESLHPRYHGKTCNSAPTPGIMVSLLQPIPSVLTPTGENLHNPRYHGKAHNNAPTPVLVLFPPLTFPLVSPTSPAVQKTLPSEPLGASSHHVSVEHEHSRLISPSTAFLSPVPGGEGHMMFPSNMIPLMPPCIAKQIPAGWYHGKAPISDAPKAILVSKVFLSPQVQAGEGHASFASNLSPPMPPHVAKRIPGGGQHRIATIGDAPKAMPISKEPVSSPPRASPLKSSSRHTIMNRIAPSMTSGPSHGLNKKGPVASPIWISPSITHWKRHGIHVAAAPREMISHSSPANHPPAKDLSPVITPTHEQAKRFSYAASPPPSLLPKTHERKRVGHPAAALSNFFRRPHKRKRIRSPASAPSHVFPPYRASAHHLEPGRAPSHAPMAFPRRHWKLGPSSSPTESPLPSTMNQLAPSLPSIVFPSYPVQGPSYPPKISPSVSLPKMPRVPVSSPVRTLSPPPLSQDCTAVTCTEPLTNTPPGSPCGCVLPMQVGLRLSVALYTFFPLVSELAQEIAAGIFLKQSQVRIMGANAASQQPEKTDVLIDLVPLGEKFDYTSAFFTYEKFWHRQVIINNAFFGDHEVLYVQYPGLPPSPPSAPMNITLNDGPFVPDINSRKMHPLGVDVRKSKNRLGGSLIAVIILSSAIVLLIFVGAAWFFLTRHEGQSHEPEPVPQTLVPPFTKPSGVGSMIYGSGPSSASLSFASSIATYTGSAKTFSLAEIEKATDGFDPAKVLGEGGFGRVYRGVLEDSMKVAVKVLKRDDQQGGREFLAEVEMLSRLHHRNLVKLIGICTEEHCRCLVYELIPNGSVESHLHGVDKERSPLDWGARMKIALGSARGLAYLHEDSSPRVIHRDFKSSNILLEDDFTPKVSDFGLARTALEEGNQHISTRVMGTFGYVAPEYAMTGHLLVKSDVYSYGVVLLELLTGRKPVDMSQPQGQENLVTWARPLLTSKEGLEMIIDPALADSFPFESVAKVAAIASMCVQPEVSHRPFMGEVVQALKLVCDDTEEKNGGSESCSQEESSAQDIEIKISSGSGQYFQTHSFRATDYNSGLEAERALSSSDLFSTSARFVRQVSGSFRRHSSSGPLRSGGSQQFWQRVKGLPRGSVSEHGVAIKLWAGMKRHKRWP